MDTPSLSDRLAGFVASNNWAEVEHVFNSAGYVKHLGMRVDLSNPDAPQCSIEEPEGYHLGGVGRDCLNGAVISGMFDLVLGLTAIKFIHLGNIATTNINIRLLHAVECGRVYATATISKNLNGRIFSEACLYDYQHQMCAYATGEIRVGIA